jgi:hypothetical protein
VTIVIDYGAALRDRAAAGPRARARAGDQHRGHLPRARHLQVPAVLPRQRPGCSRAAGWSLAGPRASTSCCPWGCRSTPSRAWPT